MVGLRGILAVAGGILYDEAVAILDDVGLRQELLQALAHTDGTVARTTAAMRRGEGLVEVDVHHVEAHVARTGHTEDRVEVGTIIIEERAAGVDELGDLGNLLLEEAQRVGVGHHDGGDVIAQERFEVLDIDEALGGALHLDDIQSADGSRGGVGAMGRIGDDHLRALDVATALMVAADDHQTRQLAMSTGAGIEREVVEASERGEAALEVIDHLQGALSRLDGLQRVEVVEARQGGHFLVDDGVVLHRAGAQGIEAVEHTEVVLAMVGVVAHDGHLVALGQLGVLLAAQPGGQLVMGEAVLRQRIGTTAGAGKLKNQISV